MEELDDERNDRRKLFPDLPETHSARVLDSRKDIAADSDNKPLADTEVSHTPEARIPDGIHTAAAGPADIPVPAAAINIGVEAVPYTPHVDARTSS